MTSLNRPFTRLSMRRRYESWFLRFGLADDSGAWWLRYLLSNPGRSGCPNLGVGAPVQVWATWFPRDGQPDTFIREFSVDELRLNSDPFLLEVGANRITDTACCGDIELRGHRISWDLRYDSKFGITLSNKGWIGSSRTPHSDAAFSGEIRYDDRVFRGSLLGFGVQGHNTGFRHRHFWTWMHAVFPQSDGRLSTVEALAYEMPFGLKFRKLVLWHEGRSYLFRKLQESNRDREAMRWVIQASCGDSWVKAEINGGGISAHTLPYVKTDCSGTFEVSNNSLASASLRIYLGNSSSFQELSTDQGAVLEMASAY